MLFDLFILDIKVIARCGIAFNIGQLSDRIAFGDPAVVPPGSF